LDLYQGVYDPDANCIESDIPLLHNDRDFDPFEQHLGLRVAAVS
jgi:hypothetical protein